jgi:CheY-like chemotaxis protein
MPLHTVLVVDPNPATHRRVDSAFRGSSRTLYARGAAEAAERCAGERLDLVISAVRLSNGNGYDLARSLRDDHPAALVFLLAGGFDVYDEDRATDAGVDGRINVPFTAASLRSRVEDALGPLPDADELTEDGGWREDTMPIAIPPAGGVAVHGPPVGEERLAVFLPRDFRAGTPVAVDPDVVGPALEKAIMEVLPEVVEGVLRSALTTSPSFRDLVEQAVAKAVEERLAAEASDD